MLLPNLIPLIDVTFSTAKPVYINYPHSVVSARSLLAVRLLNAMAGQSPGLIEQP
jgi:hypothetical protein